MCILVLENKQVFHACENGHLAVVEQLVEEHGCNVMEKNNDGMTALHCVAASAAASGESGIVLRKVPLSCSGK